jgi:VCBS repeat-containing protein
VLRFAADFEQHSESQTPALRGTIKYNYLKPAGVLANDTDADGNTLKAKLVAAPLHGTLALNTDGTFTYAPIAGFNGTDTFTYKANDGATDSNTATVTIKVGSTTTTGSIAGNLYNDLDADAIKDTGEVNLSGWKVFLDADKDGLLDTGEKTATADNSGNYKFTGLAAGTYRVRETLNSGWRRTTPSSGYHDLTLASGQNVTGKNFGNTQQILISGSVFKDLDGDGIKDAGESALSSWRVFVDADKDGVFDAGEKSTLSDSSGNYKFNLPAGTYRVREVLQSTWRRTTPTSGYFDVTLGNGASTAGRNFGNTQNVLIAGNVFNDLDGDKIKDTGETGLSGWRVFVDADNDGGFDSTEKSVLTDSSGNFSFKSLAAGSYKLRVAKPSGWSLTTPITGYINVTLASGAGSTALRFGAKRV